MYRDVPDGRLISVWLNELGGAEEVQFLHRGPDEVK